MISKPALIIIAIGAALFLAVAALLMVKYHRDPIVTIEAGGGWTVVLGPKTLLSDKNSKFYSEDLDLQGMCWWNQKLIYVVCENSREIQHEWPTLGASYAKVFHGQPPEHPEPFYGWLAHEIIGHGGDHSIKGRPLLFINVIWPQSMPREEAILAPVQNPWTTIARAWPGCESPHGDLPAIPTQKYLEATVP
jgi:hypothetical protein